MADADDIQEAPPIRDGKPKRGPGRPRKDGSPAQPRAKRGTNRRSRTGAKRNLTNDIAGILSLVNFGFAFAPASLQGDALDDNEIQALAQAINQQAQQSDAVYNALMFIFGGGGVSSINLLAVVAAIAIRRMANHEIIPYDFAMRAHTLMAAMSGGSLSVEIPDNESAPSA